jgi:hypothetical protein
MPQDKKQKHQTRRVRVLVKAFPQPSKKHEETVCVAAVDEDTREFLRLFPIRYRRLAAEHRFERFDQVTLTATKASDPRPESHQVDEGSIQVTEKAAKLSAQSRVQLWSPFVAPSLTALQEDQKKTGRSLGIIKPDPDSVEFKYKKVEDTDAEDQELTAQLFQQTSLLEDPLKPIARPEYSFAYSFTSGGKAHSYQIHDWEVQAAFHHYKKRYGTEAKALAMLAQEYGQNIPQRNLHLIMGTMHARPWQFIIIGLLRTALDPAELAKQAEMF